MSRNAVQRGCGEEIRGLCAVSTTDELSPEEWADLREHAAVRRNECFAAIPLTSSETNAYSEPASC
jgi:hypothetical protein